MRALQDRIKSLSSENTNLRAECQEEKNKREHLQEVLNRTQLEIDDIQRKLDEKDVKSKEIVNSYEVAIEDLKNENNRLQAKLEELSQELKAEKQNNLAEDLDFMLKKEKGNSARLKSELDRALSQKEQIFEEEIDGMKNEIKKLSSKCLDLEQENEVNKKVIQEKEEQIELLVEQLNSAKKAQNKISSSSSYKLDTKDYYLENKMRVKPETARISENKCIDLLCNPNRF